ncbi:MAG: hypothetical protein CL946_12795 [Ectothiorhodospiraceae bacterium]|nr:hypothetical protein [Ectothiorhodospiraceae bacterium]
MKLKIIWIDDLPSRKSSSKLLETKIKDKLNKKTEFNDAEVHFADVSQQDLFTLLDNIRIHGDADLILMDHLLTNVERPTVGSTAAEFLREKMAAMPIVCVTGENLTKIGAHRSSLYDEILAIEKVSKSAALLISIAKSYKVLREKPPKSVGQLINLLGVPKTDRERLAMILPDDLKLGMNRDKNNSILRMSRWVRNTLLERPGFLYDRLWTATLLGIKENSFHKVEAFFEGAKYSGLFCVDGRDRWWQSQLRQILADVVSVGKNELPWEMGRRLLNISKNDYSKCNKSGKDFPETVAYLDESLEDRAPMRLRYTVRHPLFEESLFFEEIRMMKG